MNYILHVIAWMAFPTILLTCAFIELNKINKD